MRSPIHWYGGKGMLTAKLLKLMPKHKHYVEVFGGGASLLFAKEPCGGVEVYNDIDSGLVNFYRVLRDKESFIELQRLAELTPYSQEEQERYRLTWQDEDDAIKRAYKSYITCRMTFGGLLNKTGWSYSINTVAKGMSKVVSGYLSSVNDLVAVHQRLRTVQIDHRDFRVIIKTYIAPGTLLYLDPPYVPGVRKELNVYKHEMSTQDHCDLVEVLLEYPEMVMLSAYTPTVIYQPLISNGWTQFKFDWVTSFSDGKDKQRSARVESVWLNPQAMLARDHQPKLL